MRDVVRNDGSVIGLYHRVDHEGYKGSVKFIGSLPDTTGSWYGVEWDDPSRGKHDGSYKGKQYFHTSSSTGGSFIRPKKVDGGYSCFLAINDRYGKTNEAHAGVIIEDLFVVDGHKKQTKVEMVGAEKVNKKQSQLDQLQEVVLRGMSVYGVGPHGSELLQHTPNIEELDISATLVSSWLCVSQITECLPKLKSLNVSDNVLPIIPGADEDMPCFSTVEILYINRMHYTWKQILQTCKMFPALKQLHCCFNSVEKLCLPSSLEQLTLLNLESNKVPSWDNVLQLAGLSRLETLILNDNKIENIYFPDVPPGDTTSCFPSLKSLSVNYNKISEWKSINELNKLQQLEEIRIVHNPIMDLATPETVRQMLVAKISTLKMCNRTEVFEDERKGAEIDYLKRFGPHWLKAGGHQDQDKDQTSAEFLQEHPRFKYFLKKYGAPETSEMEQKSKTLKDNLISVKIRNPDQPDQRIITKKLPVTMVIQKVKTLIQRLYKVGADEVTLSYISKKMPDQEIPFDNDLRQISFYSVENDDEILVRW
ncbi:tubulin-specific chaperone E-like [Mytilus trossulus]|uniref:tubulin-specific chaperone E-like n=1 Tax=Mytilus trossulus TaxID=6551 RepID=UPI0030046162